MAILIGRVPALALLGLGLAGELAPLRAAQLLVACGLAAVGLAWVWVRNLAQMAQALRRAQEGHFHPPQVTALLPLEATVAEQIHRLTLSLAEGSRLVGLLRRSDEAIVDALPDPLLVLAPDRLPLRANTAARQLFGEDTAALLRHPALAEAVERALATQRPQAAGVVIPVPVLRDLEAQVIHIDPPLVDGGALLVVLSDRTRERQVERMRADFVANASHELRTPLASLIGFIETLRGPANDDAPARARFLGIMAEQSDRMRRLVDDLLSLSRIEITEHQAPSGQADLSAIVMAEAAALEPALRGRAVAMSMEVPPGLVVAPADADQLVQVVRNLLDNAIRHGRQGGCVMVRLVPRALRGQPGLTLSVTDDGPGIAKRHIPRLTERFYRADGSRSRTAGGTGLGLAIVKHIISRHRGQPTIESQEGEGATFRVWLAAAA
jgi:two-component system phosphate regulon sensor histidine kinase PhoR